MEVEIFSDVILSELVYEDEVWVPNRRLVHNLLLWGKGRKPLVFHYGWDDEGKDKLLNELRERFDSQLAHGWI